jgi:protein SCO1/2
MVNIARAHSPYTIVLALSLAIGCTRAEPPSTYPITGQILAVDETNQALTIRHEDIPNFMPGMTMTFPVIEKSEMTGRTVGELVRATLEVGGGVARLRGIVSTGSAPISENANQLAMATELLDVGAEVPDAAFIDQTNTRRAFAEWRGTVTVLTFVYTSCPLPNFCPLMDQNFATLQGLLAEDANLRGKVKLVSISVDPQKDTPAVLAAHAAKRRADPAVWTWLTGDPATIDRFAGRFGVGILRPADSPEINHNLRTVIVDRHGRVAAIYSGNEWTPGQLLTELRAVAARP